MIKRIVRDTIGEILETGKSATKQAKQVSPSKIVKTASEQVAGDSTDGDDATSPGLEDLQGKSVSSSQLQQLKQDDAVKKKKDLDTTRLELSRVKMERYKKMQQQVKLKGEEREEKERVKKEEEEAKEEQEKKMEEQKEEQAVQLPKGPDKQPGLGIFIKQKKGTREVSKKVIG